MERSHDSIYTSLKPTTEVMRYFKFERDTYDR